jgi:hypothetical protein
MGFFDDSTSTTTNQTSNYDQRQVNTNTDSNNRFIDNSVNLDGGAIAGAVTILGKALDGASAQTMAGFNYADHIFDSATAFANNAGAMAGDAFSRASRLSQDALTGARQSYLEAGNQVSSAYGTALAGTAAAYADAKGTTAAQKQIILGVLAVAALFALVALKNKG